jgi:hypothetical protein
MNDATTQSMACITISLQAFFSLQSLENLHPSMVIQNARPPTKRKTCKVVEIASRLHKIWGAEAHRSKSSRPMSTLTPCSSTSGRLVTQSFHEPGTISLHESQMPISAVTQHIDSSHTPSPQNQLSKRTDYSRVPSVLICGDSSHEGVV